VPRLPLLLLIHQLGPPLLLELRGSLEVRIAVRPEAVLHAVQADRLTLPHALAAAPGLREVVLLGAGAVAGKAVRELGAGFEAVKVLCPVHHLEAGADGGVDFDGQAGAHLFCVCARVGEIESGGWLDEQEQAAGWQRYC